MTIVALDSLINFFIDVILLLAPSGLNPVKTKDLIKCCALFRFPLLPIFFLMVFCSILFIVGFGFLLGVGLVKHKIFSLIIIKL